MYYEVAKRTHYILKQHLQRFPYFVPTNVTAWAPKPPPSQKLAYWLT